MAQDRTIHVSKNAMLIELDKGRVVVGIDCDTCERLTFVVPLQHVSEVAVLLAEVAKQMGLHQFSYVPAHPGPIPAEQLGESLDRVNAVFDVIKSRKEHATKSTDN